MPKKGRRTRLRWGVPYPSVVGSLMYAMVCTRPDIAFAVKMVRRYMSNPGREHWATVKWILRYLKGTSKVCLKYGLGKPMLEGLIDSSMSGDVGSSRSTSRYVMTYIGGAMSWKSRLQKFLALLTGFSTLKACELSPRLGYGMWLVPLLWTSLLATSSTPTVVPHLPPTEAGHPCPFFLFPRLGYLSSPLAGTSVLLNIRYWGTPRVLPVVRKST